jgi:dTDP-4-dehydrorhamnose reductase
VLVLGSEGMLGQACLRWFMRRGDWRVEGTRYLDRAHPLFFDAEGPAGALEEILSGGHFDYAINCIGILGSAIHESDSDSVARAIRVNALLPHQLARAASNTGTRVVHVSTDGVFSGSSQSDYFEDSPLDCLDAYGKSKALGECRAPNFLSIRCSIVGRDWVEGKGIVEWFLRTPAGTAITGFTDHLWTGITTYQFAELCARIAERNAFDSLRRESHVYHFAPNPTISKFDLLATLECVTGRGVGVRRGKSPAGPMRRVLKSRFSGLSDLYESPGGWQNVLREAIE